MPFIATCVDAIGTVFWDRPIMTQGRLVLRKRMPERSLARQSNVEKPETTAGAVGGDTLLNIPPCSMAEGPGEQSQSLFRPPMSDPEVDLEH